MQVSPGERVTQRDSEDLMGTKRRSVCVCGGGGGVLRESGQFSEKLKFQPFFFKKKFNLALEDLELTAILLPQLLEAYPV